jgi:hypothetical protein
MSELSRKQNQSTTPALLMPTTFADVRSATENVQSVEAAPAKVNFANIPSRMTKESEKFLAIISLAQWAVHSH